jgi:archaellum component FlaC
MDDMKLDRVLAKLDNVSNELSRLTERMVAGETKIGERTTDIAGMYRRMEKLEDRVSELEKHKTQMVGFKDIATWTVMAGIALWGVLK